MAKFLLFLFLPFLIAMALTPVVEVFWPWPWPWWQGLPWQKQLFWSFLVGCADEDWFSYNDNNGVLAGGLWEDLFCLKSLKFLSFFLFGRCPWEHQKSIFFIPDGAWKLALALTSIVLSSTSSQESRSLSQTSSWAQIEDQRLFQKYQIIRSSLGVAMKLNSQRTACN